MLYDLAAIAQAQGLLELVTDADGFIREPQEHLLLPGRRHIVLTRDPVWQAEGAERAGTMADALALAGEPRVSVIGGAEVFRLFLPLADRIELTEVHAEVEGDTVLPPFDSAHWREVARETHGAEDGRPAYSFVTLTRQ